LTPAALQRIKVRKSFEVKLPPPEVEPPRVLARWNNQTAAPAVLQKVYGDGSVLLWTTAADRSWSDWPTEASYVLAVREAARAIARTDARFRAYTAGQALSVPLPASHNISLPAIEVPHGKEPVPLVVSGAAARQGPRALSELSYRDTRRAGMYKMMWRDSVSGSMTRQFAVNPDQRESNLQRIKGQEFRSLWGALEPEVISIGSQGDASLAMRGREVWRMLATCLLGMLVFEACFARWAGRQR
jgi:hypothetical protein